MVLNLRNGPFFIISCEILVFPADNVRTSAGKITACQWLTYFSKREFLNVNLKQI